jgi:hypothetical protein
MRADRMIKCRTTVLTGADELAALQQHPADKPWAVAQAQALLAALAPTACTRQPIRTGVIGLVGESKPIPLGRHVASRIADGRFHDPVSQVRDFTNPISAPLPGRLTESGQLMDDEQPSGPAKIMAAVRSRDSSCRPGSRRD